MVRHSKWKIIQNRMSLKMECLSKRNVTQNAIIIILGMESTQNDMSLKWNLTRNGMSLKNKLSLKKNVT